MIEEFTQQTGIIVHLEMENIDRSFEPRTDIIVYRIFQEAFTNIRKHADATRVRVVVNKRADDVYVSIEDNGKGFVMDRAADGNGSEIKMGFLAMEERARMLGTLLKHYSISGQGTRIIFSIPVAGG
jgi:signal transduction histidine kinase